MKHSKIKIPEGVIIFAFLFVVLIAFSFFKTDDENPVHNFPGEYSIHAVTLPDTLYFAGERVPLEYIDVKEELDKELLVNTYWQSHTILLIKRAHKYFPVIEPILEEQGIHDDFKYMAVAESNLMNIISPANAVGMWQFLEETAKEYGLEVNEEVDERYHLEKSTRAACLYIHDSYKKYGNWTLVAASYNMGRNGLDSQIEKQQEKNYYNLFLNDETARYVYRILALKCILSNPERYGFYIDESDMYNQLPYYEIEIDSTIHNIAEFAKIQGTNYKIVKKLNPWLRANILSNKEGKTYSIRIPEKGARENTP